MIVDNCAIFKISDKPNTVPVKHAWIAMCIKYLNRPHSFGGMLPFDPKLRLLSGLTNSNP
jgi:hypothetical protein